MSEQTVARQYAGALFAVAQRNNTTEAVRADIDAFGALLRGHEELRGVFASAAVPPRKKQEVVEALLERTAPATDEFRRLLLLMAERDRLALFDQVAHAYQVRLQELEQVIAATVTTAAPLSEGADRRLADALSAATGKRVSVVSRLEPSLMGGFVAEVGSVVFDGSIAGQLGRMRQRVASGL